MTFIRLAIHPCGKPQGILAKANKFELLKVIAGHPGKIVACIDLVSAHNRNYRAGDMRSIDSHMKNLRVKMYACSPDTNFIKTFYDVGYSLNLSSDAFEQKESNMNSLH